MTKKLLAIFAALVFVLVVWIIALVVTQPMKKPGYDSIVDSDVQNTDVSINSGLEDSVFDDELFEDSDVLSESEQANESLNDESHSTNQGERPTETTKPTPKPEETKSPEVTVEPSEPAQPGTLDYITFQNMSGAEQQVHMESFGDIEAFFVWYNAAKEKYEKENPPIEVDGGPIDIGSIIEGEN